MNKQSALRAILALSLASYASKPEPIASASKTQQIRDIKDRFDKALKKLHKQRRRMSTHIYENKRQDLISERDGLIAEVRK